MVSDQRVYLLTQTASQVSLLEGSHWRFMLKSLDQTFDLDASDFEPQVFGEQMELLTLVRGLEALETESSVTLVTDSRYVIRGLRYGLDEWREHDWKWQRFGEFTDINYANLWQRVDNALQYHRLQCRYFRIDNGHSSDRKIPKPHFNRRRQGRLLRYQEATSHKENSDYIDPMTGLSRRWMDAAESLAITMDCRWDQTLETV